MVRIVLESEPACGDCGHPRYQHRPVPLREHYSADGHVSFESIHGRCEHHRLSGLRLTGIPCGCPEYVPDCYPRVTEMLGSARREIEVAAKTRTRKAPERDPRLDLGNVQRGDLIDITYGAYRTTQRVKDVARTFDGVQILFEDTCHGATAIRADSTCAVCDTESFDACRCRPADNYFVRSCREHGVLADGQAIQSFAEYLREEEYAHERQTGQHADGAGLT